MSFCLEFKNVFFQYTGIGGSDRNILHDISLSIEKPECIALVGPSGSGKTTLVQHFTGLLKPVRGSINFNGRNIWEKPHQFTALRQKIGLVFQFPESQLFEETVFKDIAFGPEKLGVPKDEISERIHSAMKAVGLSFDDFAERSPFKLSEGEKRRVAIAGILAMQPEMVVMDEPTAGLDPRGVRQIISIIDSLVDSGIAVVLITHNMELVARLAQRVIVLRDGVIVWDNSPKLLFDNADILAQTHLEVPDTVKLLKNHQSLLNIDINSPPLEILLSDYVKTFKNIYS